MAKLTVAIIGCGRKGVGRTGCGIGHHHAEGYRACEDVRFVAFCDIVAENAEAFGAEHGTGDERLYTDYHAMLRTEQPDVVSVATWPALHAPMTVDVASHRPKAIVCEKPIALSLGEADAMLDACKHAGTRLIVGHQRRFSPQYQAAHSALHSGAIGVLELMETHGHPGCSLLVDGTHTVDLVRWFAGDQPIQWVFAQIDATARRSAWGSAVENAAMLLFRFENGIRTFVAWTEGRPGMSIRPCLIRASKFSTSFVW